MMSLESILALSRAEAVIAAANELEPYQPTSAGEVEQYNHFPFPNLGQYRPEGWTLVEHELVDKTGEGAEYEPALTIRGLKAWCIERMIKDETAGFAIIEEGQFQVVVGYFSQAEDAVQDPDDNGITEKIEWVYCINCSQPIEESLEYCDLCGADQNPEPEPEEEPTEAWQEGWDAYEEGQPQGINPYALPGNFPEDEADWDAGYTAAKAAEVLLMEAENQPNLGL